ncbi:hypothetical protein [Streptomyces sp. NPDC006668]|uniref:hypothetical protein n=1 Tax=Streptomyces sp. NPDC006668 TaxID=3156903 RepID=UPI0033FEFB0F
MSQLVRKAAVAMAATAVVSALTGIGSVPAYADSSSIQAVFCKASEGTAIGLRGTGTSQNNQQVTWRTDEVPYTDCEETDGYWWKKGTVITLLWEQDGLVHNGACPVPNSNDDHFFCNFG